MTRFHATLRAIGDLDDDFYAEEFQRDAWNEASAIGFQLWLWSALIAAAILPWIGGSAGCWTALGLLVAAGSISATVVRYFRMRSRIDPHASARWRRPRTALVLTLYAAAVFGLVVHLADSVPGELWFGAVIGMVAGATAAVVATMRARRDAAGPDDDE
ncbi:DUF2029 domain-containing protein [Williamsia sp. CHRR-6]|uniref:DUF2029 domain-containing protein n=1 Tax=Williamsia sp. CHRR-6 TaxID=2835871 RepID=UPI001BDAAD66|nr:DUF2029 domain-containing protein [Williamsia sp. CHRR-6]MBT0568308.1 DUF2029 domain-containing protein [Williamsia sp. CHRR-6]